MTQFKIEYVTSMFSGRYKSPSRLGQAPFHNGSAVRAVLTCLTGVTCPIGTWGRTGVVKYGWSGCGG